MTALRDAAPPGEAGGYFAQSRRPLQILAYLLPLLVAYEICLAFVLHDADAPATLTVEAHRQLLSFFAAFGIAPEVGLHLGGLVVVLVLLAWHLLARDPWRVSGSACVVMGIESILLALPLVAASALVATRLAATQPVGGAPIVESLGLPAQLAISVGAGIYEELAFRMILIAIIHVVVVDVARAPHRTGLLIAVPISALAFTLYHDLQGPDGLLDARRAAFLFAAGIYFGVLYAGRGFGIAVGAHAAYDVITVILGRLEG